MKKQLALAAGLAVLAAPAFASKARLAALGEDTNGSFYIQDNRNIFLNASEVNNQKDFVTYELENDGGNGEGGFIRNAGNLVWGAHMGRNLSYNEGTDSFATDANDDGDVDAGDLFVYQATNALDLFIGGDAGIKWGVQLTYSSQKNDDFNAGDGGAGLATNTEAKTDVMDLAVGLSQGPWAAYLKYGITGKTDHKDQDVEVERKGDTEIGGSYSWNGYTAFGYYGMNEFEVDGDNNVESNEMSLGVARQDKLNDKAVLFTKVAYTNTTSDVKDAGEDGENNESDLSATIGLEFDAASWLTLRGSVSQEILINEVETKAAVANSDSNKNTEANTTVVAAGASLKFGDMAVDGMIGNTASGTAGEIDSSNLMTRVSMTYRF
ncbi:MAG: hypothetical protein ACLGG0_00700 [Bacteriovoracia bacterium]